MRSPQLEHVSSSALRSDARRHAHAVGQRGSRRAADRRAAADRCGADRPLAERQRSRGRGLFLASRAHGRSSAHAQTGAAREGTGFGCFRPQSRTQLAPSFKHRLRNNLALLRSVIRRSNETRGNRPSTSRCTSKRASARSREHRQCVAAAGDAGIELEELVRTELIASAVSRAALSAAGTGGAAARQGGGISRTRHARAGDQLAEVRSTRCAERLGGHHVGGDRRSGVAAPARELDRNRRDHRVGRAAPAGLRTGAHRVHLAVRARCAYPPHVQPGRRALRDRHPIGGVRSDRRAAAQQAALGGSPW